MNRLLPFALLVSSVIGLPVMSAANVKAATPPAAASPADKSALVGQFTGKWKSATDKTGDLRLKFKHSADATWSAEASFTFQEKEVPTTMKTVQVDGPKVQLVFDWQIDGTEGQSKINGELVGDTLKGTYETSGAAGTSSGTWTVTRS